MKRRTDDQERDRTGSQLPDGAAERLRATRGGMGDATDAELARVWDAMAPADRERLMEGGQRREGEGDRVFEGSGDQGEEGGGA
jgi:hypothetical protein